jgi:hypothetical protein
MKNHVLKFLNIKKIKKLLLILLIDYRPEKAKYNRSWKIWEHYYEYKNVWVKVCR